MAVHHDTFKSAIASAFENSDIKFSKVSYLSVSSEGETSETDLCLKDKDVNALKQIVDFAKQFAGM